MPDDTAQTNVDTSPPQYTTPPGSVRDTMDRVQGRDEFKLAPPVNKSPAYDANSGITDQRVHGDDTRHPIKGHWTQNPKSKP